MMKKNRLTIVILLCLTVLLAACGESGQENGGNQAQMPGSGVLLASEGEACFALIGKSGTEYMDEMQEQMKQLLGTDIAVYSSAAKAPAELAKVVVGNPDRLGTKALSAQVPYFGYLMVVEDGTVYILAYDDYVLEEAVGVFCEMAAQSYADGGLTVAEDYRVVADTSAEYGITKVTYLEGGRNPGVHDLGDAHHMVLVSDVQAQEYKTYCEQLVSEGYSLYMENEMNGNLFRTYTNTSGIMLHTYWLEYYEEARIIVAQDPELPVLNNAGEKICTPLLHQLEALSVDKTDGGMGYIVRLEDGRFLIFDGGDDNSDCRTDIYDFLKANAPDPENIVIAAWYISHAHADHYGAFEGFARSYAKDETIHLESVLYNACDTSEQLANASSGSPDIDAALKRYYPDVPVIKPMTGQKLTFSGTTIEIAYTMSDFLPNVITKESDWESKGIYNGDYNVQTMVCIIDIDSTADRKDRLFLMGDTTAVACDEMSTRYGGYLKCDMVQVSHHGLGQPAGKNYPRRNNSTVEIYTLVDPDIALWPTSVAKMEERGALPVNQFLLSIVDSSVCAGNGGYTFEFGD